MDAAKRATRPATPGRIAALVAQFGLLALLALACAGAFHAAFGAADPVVARLAWLPVVLRGLGMGALVCLAWLALVDRPALARLLATPAQARHAAVHFAVGIALLTGSLIAPPLIAVDTGHASATLIWYLAAPALWAVYAASGYRLAVPRAFAFAPRQARALVAIMLGAMIALALWRTWEGADYPGSAALTEATIHLAAIFSHAIGHSVHPIGYNEVHWPIYRTGSYDIVIAPSCAGSEGLILIPALLALVVFIERRTLRMAVAVPLIALAAATMFVLNALRIAALLYIGDIWSPEVAINGFHTNFGLVSLSLVSIVYAFAIHRFAGTERLCPPAPSAIPASPPPTDAPDVRLAVPLAVMIAALLVTGLMTATFHWLYPVTTLAVVVALWRQRLPGRFAGWQPTLLPLAAGLGVLVMWIALIPDDPAASATFADTLFGAPALVASVWLMVRLIGSAVVVPIAEELAFRAFMLPWLTGLLERHLPARAALALAVIASSAAFGLAHTDMLPGFLAGLAYAGVYLHRRNRFDAILAHATTNLALGLYAMIMGMWSYL